MKMKEINKQVTETGDESAISDMLSSLNNLQNEIYEPVKKIVEGYQEDVTTCEELLQVKKHYFKKKYLNRIRGQLAGKL